MIIVIIEWVDTCSPLGRPLDTGGHWTQTNGETQVLVWTVDWAAQARPGR